MANGKGIYNLFFDGPSPFGVVLATRSSAFRRAISWFKSTFLSWILGFDGVGLSHLGLWWWYAIGCMQWYNCKAQEGNYKQNDIRTSFQKTQSSFVDLDWGCIHAIQQNKTPLRWLKKSQVYNWKKHIWAEGLCQFRFGFLQNFIHGICTRTPRVGTTWGFNLCT